MLVCVCASVLCENEIRVLDLRSVSVCILATLKSMAENEILELWRVNQANTIDGKGGFICSTCMALVKQKCSSASPQSASETSPRIFSRTGNQEQSNVDRFACNLVTQEKLPDIFGLLI